MADFKYNPETDEYEYVGTGYEGAPDAVAQPSEPTRICSVQNLLIQFRLKTIS